MRLRKQQGRSAGSRQAGNKPDPLAMIELTTQGRSKSTGSFINFETESPKEGCVV